MIFEFNSDAANLDLVDAIHQHFLPINSNSLVHIANMYLNRILLRFHRFINFRLIPQGYDMN